MSDFEKWLESFGPQIDGEIEKLIPHKLSEANVRWFYGPPRYKYDVETLNKAFSVPVWDLLDRGGKRWRPVLMMLTYEAVSGKPMTQALEYTPLIEVIHNGTLVVDDIEDSSPLRRNKPTLHLIYGVDVAVNAGNAMYFMPMALLYNNKNLSPEKKAKLYDTVIQELLTCHAGQGMDIVWHKGMKENITEDEYLQMCAYKTGVLARLAAKVGAELADASEKQVNALGRFGEAIGVAFQIQDDILNITESEVSQAKGVGEDIHEGKRTIMVIHALQKANAQDKARLLEILNMHTENQKLIIEAINILKKYDAISYAKKRATQIVEDALKEVEGAVPESKAKEKIREFAHFLISRNK